MRGYTWLQTSRLTNTFISDASIIPTSMLAPAEPFSPCPRKPSRTGPVANALPRPFARASRSASMASLNSRRHQRRVRSETNRRRGRVKGPGRIPLRSVFAD